MNSLARHQASVEHKDENNRVELEHGALEHGTPGKRVMDPALRHPVSHDGVQTERRGDGRALEIGGLAVGVLWDGGRGHVEAGEAGEAAEDEEAEAEMVERSADADGEGNDGGGDAEGDLQVGRSCGLDG